MPTLDFLSAVITRAKKLPLQVELHISVYPEHSHPTWNQLKEEELISGFAAGTHRFATLAFSVEVLEVPSSKTVLDEEENSTNLEKHGVEHNEEDHAEDGEDEGIDEDNEQLNFISAWKQPGPILFDLEFQTPLNDRATIHTIFNGLLEAGKSIQHIYHMNGAGYPIHFPSADLWAIGCPWPYLTQIYLPFSMTTFAALDMLRQCMTIQQCTLSVDQGTLSTPSPSCQLHSLQHLDITIEDDMGDSNSVAVQFFGALELPALTSMFLNTQSFPATLSDLHHRRAFNLEQLELNLEQPNGCVLIPFLRLLPSLERLFIMTNWFDDDLLHAFTYDSSSPFPSLTLPKLRSLHLEEAYHESHRHSTGTSGPSLARMALSLQAHRDIAFPLLKNVSLNVVGDEFDADVEMTLRTTEIIKYQRSC
ncbi:hypothetical protein B0H19DRAFT_1065294 [Mycena capillaripes]|nr:hypothetical protein B0H19DRAFT_1065294 [Mycena capillaripes]